MDSETNRNWEAEWKVIKQELEAGEQVEDAHYILLMMRVTRREAEWERRGRRKEELDHQLKEAKRQLAATERNIKEMNMKKTTEGIQKELRNKRALQREIRKINNELEELYSSWEIMRP
ncbi:hypothetical protein GCK72_011183 [Caenorhabditis remanei]|uniref:Uncharacterized protein n=1 Tax=Caenorhabditis remanei TaxID=31234 RepID=A0A6A5H783_CAERE|nr:hypothetical protein GCK72_011183 [Caenorhabditis remanei]KAF1762919.1 hypothetical protein GCK72_011183 [Caenorhabditis remanei]